MFLKNYKVKSLKKKNLGIQNWENNKNSPFINVWSKEIKPKHVHSLGKTGDTVYSHLACINSDKEYISLKQGRVEQIPYILNATYGKGKSGRNT